MDTFSYRSAGYESPTYTAYEPVSVYSGLTTTAPHITYAYTCTADTDFFECQHQGFFDSAYVNVPSAEVACATYSLSE